MVFKECLEIILFFLNEKKKIIGFPFLLELYQAKISLCSQKAGLLTVPKIYKSRMGGRAFS